MTTRLLQLTTYLWRRKQGRQILDRVTDEDVWAKVRGMWKEKEMDPVQYQRQLRDEADQCGL